MPRRGRLTAIAADVHELVRRVGPRGKGVPAELYPAWDVVVGPAVARVTRLDSLVQGVLAVVTKNSVWVSELMMLREQILGGLEAQLGEVLVRDLRFRVGRIHGRAISGDRPSVPPIPSREIPLSTRGRLDDVRDPDLRATIAKALSRTRPPK